MTDITAESMHKLTYRVNEYNNLSKSLKELLSSIKIEAENGRYDYKTDKKLDLSQDDQGYLLSIGFGVKPRHYGGYYINW